jgi:hypothetical protein
LSVLKKTLGHSPQLALNNNNNIYFIYSYSVKHNWLHEYIILSYVHKVMDSLYSDVDEKADSIGLVGALFGSAGPHAVQVQWIKDFTV